MGTYVNPGNAGFARILIYNSIPHPGQIVSWKNKKTALDKKGYGSVLSD